MQTSHRALLNALVTLALMLSLASPAAANSLSRGDTDLDKSVPIVLDVLVLRPLGLAVTALGAVVYAFPVAPITAITRPGDLGKPLGPLVATPARFTFRDPLGHH